MGWAGNMRCPAAQFNPERPVVLCYARRVSVLRLLCLALVAGVGAGNLGAATNFDRYTWAGGPIVMTVDPGNASAAVSPPDELRAAVVSAMAEWNAALGVPLFQVAADATAGAPAASSNRNPERSMIVPAVLATM